MVCSEIVQKARLSIKIQGRYTQPGCPGLDRNDWTPKQKRRMRKKFRKHGINVPPFAESGK